MLRDHFEPGDELAVYRTVGGLYVWNGRQGRGGKATALRRQGPHVQPEILRVAMLKSAAVVGERFELVDHPRDVIPGSFVVVQRVIGDQRFLRTSVIVETHHGRLVDEVGVDAPHLVFGEHSAYLLPTGDPTQAVRLHDEGHNAEPGVMADTGDDHLTLRIDSSVLPENCATTLRQGGNPAYVQFHERAVEELRAEYPSIRLRQVVQVGGETFAALAGIPAERGVYRGVRKKLHEIAGQTYSVCECGQLMPCSEHYPEG